MLDEIFDKTPILISKVKCLINLIKSSKSPLVFTGAGISTSAGIPDFRSSYKTTLKTGPGVWESEDNRSKYQGTPIIKPAIECYPTITHMALKTLIDHNIIKHLITQNVDNLHMRSGITESYLTELHGNICKEYCEKCQKTYYRDYYVKPRNSDPLEVLTNRNCKYCHVRLKKTLVNFGEKIPILKLLKCNEIVKECDICICLGSSLRVNPASKIPKEFSKNQNKKLAFINLQKGIFEEFADISIYGYCDDIMEMVMKELGLEIEEFKIKKKMFFLFNKENNSIRMRIYGKIPEEINKDFHNIQEIEVFDEENKEFYKRNDEEDLEFTFKENTKELNICVKFYGNLLEPNANFKINLEKEPLFNGVNLGFDLVLDNFLKEWKINKFHIK